MHNSTILGWSALGEAAKTIDKFANKSVDRLSFLDRVDLGPFYVPLKYRPDRVTMGTLQSDLWRYVFLIKITLFIHTNHVVHHVMSHYDHNFNLLYCIINQLANAINRCNLSAHTNFSKTPVCAGLPINNSLPCKQQVQGCTLMCWQIRAFSALENHIHCVL